MEETAVNAATSSAELRALARRMLRIVADVARAAAALGGRSADAPPRLRAVSGRLGYRVPTSGIRATAELTPLARAGIVWGRAGVHQGGRRADALGAGGVRTSVG